MVINHQSRWSLYKSLAFCVDHSNRETGTANVLPKRRPRSWSVDQIVPYFGCILEALYGKILGKDKACDGIFSFKRTSPFPPFQKCQRQRMEYQRSTTIDLLSQGLGRGLVDRWQTRSSTERHSLPRALVKISFGQQTIKAQIKKMIWWANTSQWQEAPTQPLQETWSLQVDRIIVKLKLQYFLQQCEVNMVCYNKGLNCLRPWRGLHKASRPPMSYVRPHVQLSYWLFGQRWWRWWWCGNGVDQSSRKGCQLSSNEIVTQII